ncbi:DUF748 domain-containing protein [Marinoscillum furvescens]|uniref:Uncharacterized protein DUF748 n=1 Tax=Marinoscillum furvescens DSM 4134 TaxID=1122208 RepID=A0A3D9L2C3_MARFU|nr:DUF748 domain-containing protein [Marinoscillum furvescens]RED97534.1 uncharacterized protein DUF748 [Marinoscillum furvescens DSM 4134]
MAASRLSLRKKVILALISLVLLFGAYFILFPYGSRVAGQLLKSLIAQQTSEQYTIDFEAINLHPLRKELRLEKFKLKPTTTETTNGNERWYEVTIPTLEIKLSALLEVYLSRALSFERIHITDPVITLYRTGNNLKEANISLETGDLYQLISGYLSHFSIDSLGIANASFEYLQQDSASLVLLRDIDFRIKNLLIDSTGSQDKFLFTDEIYLSLTDQSFHLKDSIHELTFDQFSISTNTGDISFRDLKVFPKKSSQAPLKAQYLITVPELNFRGLDFLNYYNKNELILDSVRLYHPTFTLHKSPQKKTDNKTELPHLLSELFDNARIGKVYIDDGKLALYSPHTDTPTVFAEHIHCMLQDVRLDSANLTYNKKQYFENARVYAENIAFHPANSPHIRFKTLDINSLEKSLIADSLVVSSSPTSNNEIEAYLPHTKAVGIDFMNLWLYEDLSVDTLMVYRPVVKASLDTSSQTPLPLRHVSVHVAQLFEGDFEIFHPKGNGKVEEFSMALTSITYQKDTLSKFQWKLSAADSRNIYLQIGTTETEISGLTAGDQLRSLTLDNVRIAPGTDRHPIHIKSVNLSGFEMERWKNQGFVAFDTLGIIQPTVAIDLQQESSNTNLKPYLNALAHHLAFDQVRLSHGEFRLFKDDQLFSHLDSLEFTLTSFHYDSLLDEYFTGIDMHVDSFHIVLPEANHELYGRSISISQNDSTLDLINLAVTPLQSDSSLTNLRLYTEELELHHLDFHQLINTGKIHFVNGQITRPQAQLHLFQKPGNPQTTGITKEWLKFETFKILNGQIDLHQPANGLGITSKDLTLAINHLDLTNDSLFLFAKSYQVESPHTAFKTESMTDSLRIDHLHAHTGTGYFEFSNIHLEQPGFIDLKLPHSRVTGLDVKALKRNKSLNLDSLHLDNPQVVFHLNRSQKQQNNIPNIQLKHLNLKGADLWVLHPTLNLGDSMHLADADLSLDRLILSPEQKPSSLSDLFTNLKLSGNKLYYNLPDSLFALSLDKFQLNQNEETLALNKLALVPLYNKGEFQSQINYQQDWFDAIIPQLTVKGLNLDTLVFQKALKINHIDIRSPYLDTHRDKRLPMPSEVYKPLPQQALRQAPWPLHIDSVTIHDAYIAHTEFAPKSEYPGKIYFKNLHAELNNITNRPGKDHYMHLHATGTLMESGNLMVASSYHLTDTTNSFTFTGEVKSMDLKELNQFLEPTAFVKVRDGHNERITFTFEANEDYAVGKMKFYYDDLKIGVLSKESYDTKGLGSSLKSFFANTFVVNTRNPHFLFVRNGDIFHERNHNKSVFNYWAKSVLSGVISSIGAKNTRKEIRQQNDEIRAKYDALDNK